MSDNATAGSTTGGGCTAAGNVYNPSGCDISADPRCAVGALGQRHPFSATDIYSDGTGNFTLFGRFSIMGRYAEKGHGAYRM